jgi:fructokinase
MVAIRPYRIGLDLGGTKLAGIMLGPDDRVVAETRRPAPRHDYDATIATIADVIAHLSQDHPDASIGIGMPGSISPRTRLVQNANSTWINGKPFHDDLEAAVGQPVKLSNDANCFALSEAHDGAAAGASNVFGVIIGTGVGGAIVISGALVEGPHAMAGEWGHTPLPWLMPDEYPGPTCWCGRKGCIETWVSGTGLAADHARVTGDTTSGEIIAARAANGDRACQATLDRHADRLARGLAVISNILDPEVIVLGGGLSQMQPLYEVLPALMRRHMFTGHPAPEIRAPRWGDASGVRGAARLWS